MANNLSPFGQRATCLVSFAEVIGVRLFCQDLTIPYSRVEDARTKIEAMRRGPIFGSFRMLGERL